MRRLPLLAALALAASACGGKPEAPPSPGRALFQALNCRVCHVIGAEGGRGGPDLTLVGFRHGRDWLDVFLKDPQAWRKDTLMPNPRLSDASRAALVDYLSSLKGQAFSGDAAPWSAASFKGGAAERGHLIYARAGCIACHGKAGAGRYPNNNVAGGLIPSLQGVSDTFTRDELKKKIRRGSKPVKADPKGAEPLVFMPAWGEVLGEPELDALADYLLSLKGGASAAEIGESYPLYDGRSGQLRGDFDNVPATMNGKYGWGLPIAASTYAKDIDFGIKIIHWAMLAIFVLWGIFFTFLLIRYRKRDGVPAQREDAGHGHFNSLIPDIVVMIFELGLIFFYAIPVWSSIKIKMPRPEDSNRVDVIAEQFAWNAHYPGPDGKFGRRDPALIHFSNPIGLDREDPAAQDDVVLANELRMPLGKPTLIYLSSKDVIHSFFVPEFRIKQDAVPGMVIPVWVEPTMEGTFEISCAQLCGFAHSLMRGDVIVESPDKFKTWITGQAPAKEEATPASESW